MIIPRLRRLIAASPWRRQKRSRSRRRLGKLLITIEVDEYGLAAALIASQRLTAEAALDRKRVIAEADVDDFIEVWPPCRKVFRDAQ
jgi:hypothetical protein